MFYRWSFLCPHFLWFLNRIYIKHSKIQFELVYNSFFELLLVLLLVISLNLMAFVTLSRETHLSTARNSTLLMVFSHAWVALLCLAWPPFFETLVKLLQYSIDSNLFCFSNRVTCNAYICFFNFLTKTSAAICAGNFLQKGNVKCTMAFKNGQVWVSLGSSYINVNFFLYDKMGLVYYANVEKWRYYSFVLVIYQMNSEMETSSRLLHY